jgi:Flp pilus assembly protein TadD
LGLGRSQEATGLLGRAVASAPAQTQFRIGWARALVASGRDADAVAALQEGLDLNAQAGRIAIALVRVLSTSPQDDVRDGQRAVRLGEQWVRRTRQQNPAALDVLACAYAEVGRFNDAIRFATRALALVSESEHPELGPSISLRIELFKQGKPVRRTPTLES